MKMLAILCLGLFGAGLGTSASAQVPAPAAYVPPPAPQPQPQAGVAVAKELIPGLIEALKDEDETVRTNVTYTLLAIGEAAAPALIKALHDENKTMRVTAASILGKMGKGAHSNRILFALLKALKDKDVEVRRAASAALIIQASPVPPPAACYPAITPTSCRY
jgi:HEAT repeat protein